MSAGNYTTLTSCAYHFNIALPSSLMHEQKKEALYRDRKYKIGEGVLPQLSGVNGPTSRILCHRMP